MKTKVVYDVISSLEDIYLEQVWAEAYALYNAGETLVLEGAAEEIAKKNQLAALENDDNPLHGPTTYNLGDVQFGDQSTPAWVQAVLKTAETLD